MSTVRGCLTPYLAAALRLGGPGCERAFLAREEREMLRGTPPRDIQAVRGPGPRGDGPEPKPVVLRLVKTAAWRPRRTPLGV